MEIINITIIAITILVSYFTYPSLPDRLPTHWNFAGEVDAYGAKGQAILMAPLLLIGVYVLFKLFPRLDPKREKYKLFMREWKIIQTVILSFFALMQFGTIYVSLHQEADFVRILFSGIGVMFVVMGNYLSKIRQNYFLGIKLPWTLANEDNWNKTHRFGSWCFVLAGLVILISALTGAFAQYVILVSLLFVLVLPTTYSYLLFRKSK